MENKRPAIHRGRNAFGVDAKAKEDSKTINFTLRKSLYNTIFTEAKSQNGKISTIIKNVLIELYDERTDSFSIYIDPIHQEPNEAVAVYLPKKIARKIERLSVDTNKSKSEIVEELLLRFLSGEGR